MQIRVEVRKIQQQRSLSDDQTHQLFQQNFEHSLDQLIGAIRNQHRVSEKAMDSSFKQHQVWLFLHTCMCVHACICEYAWWESDREVSPQILSSLPTATPPPSFGAVRP